MEDLYLYTTIAIIPLVVLTLIAGFVVQFRFAKYSKENNLSGLTGAQAARKILDEHGLFDVAIVRIEGNLTDNFNPKPTSFRCRRKCTTAILSPPLRLPRTRSDTRYSTRKAMRR